MHIFSQRYRLCEEKRPPVSNVPKIPEEVKMRRLGIRWIKLLSLLLVATITFFTTSAHYFDSRFLRDLIRKRSLQAVIGQGNRSHVMEQQTAPQVNDSERDQVSLCRCDASKQQFESSTRLKGMDVTKEIRAKDFAREESRQFREESDLLGSHLIVQTEKSLTNYDGERKWKKRKSSRKRKKSAKKKSANDEKQRKDYDASDSGDENETEDRRRTAKRPSLDLEDRRILPANNSAGQVEAEATVRNSWKEVSGKPLPRKILLLSTFRSGGSFLGEILAVTQKETFYR